MKVWCYSRRAGDWKERKKWAEELWMMINPLLNHFINSCYGSQQTFVVFVWCHEPVMEFSLVKEHFYFWQKFDRFFFFLVRIIMLTMTFIQGEGVAMDIYSSDLHLVFRMWATQLKETSTSSGATVLYCMWSCGPETSLVYMWPTFWVYVYRTTEAMSFTPQFPLEPGTVLFSRSGISWPTFTAFVGSDQLPSFKPLQPPQSHSKLA